MKAALSRARDDVGETSCAAPDLGRHPPRVGLNLFDRVHVEIGEGRAAHLRIADVGSIHREDRFDAALSVDGKLLRKVGRAVGIGHRARGEQQKRAEITLVERQLAHGLAGKLFASRGCGFCSEIGHRERVLVGQHQDHCTAAR